MEKNTEILNKTAESELFCLPCDRTAVKTAFRCPLEFEFIVGNRTVVPRGHSTSWRTMPFHLCCVGMSPRGEGSILRIGNRKPVELTQEKRFVFIPAGVTHRIDDVGASEHISLWIHFRMRFLQIFDVFTAMRTPALFGPLTDPGIEELLLKIIREPGKLNPGRSILHQMYGISLAARLLERAYPDGKGMDWEPGKDRKRLFPALEMLNRAEKKPDVAALAASVHLSPSRFLSLFSREMGMSAGQYYKRNLFSRACRLLADPEKSIADCADELGFADSCHFSREFRKYSGITPSGYRKELFPDSIGGIRKR